MAKKFLSLIIVPHNKSSSRTLSFTRRTVKAAFWGGIGLAVLLAGITVDYIRIQLTHESYKTLLAENQKQKADLEKYQSKFTSLQTDLGKFDEYMGKINTMFGFRTPNKMDLPNGMGGGGDQGPGGGGAPQLSLGSVQNLQDKASDIQKNFDIVLQKAETLASTLASTPSIWPTNGWPSSGLGWRADPFTGKQAYHSGLDIAAAYGNPVVAPADGYVISTTSDKYYGNFIQINHGGGITTLYGHLSKIEVRPGQRVKRGDEIGKVGATGRAIGPHLHYEVRENNIVRDPMRYILD